MTLSDFRNVFLLVIVFLASMAFGEMQYVDVRDQRGNVRKLSRLIMGTDHLVQADWVQQGQPEPTQAQVFAVLDEALKRGINVIDTSPIYVGGVEHLIGKWIESRNEMLKSDDFYVDKNLNPDRKIYVISKGGFPFDLFYSKTLEGGPHSKELISELKRQDILEDGRPGQPLKNVPPGSYASRLYGSKELIRQRVSEEIAHTLNNLKNVELIYLMHRDDFDSLNFNVVERKQTPVEEIMKALSCMECSGKFVMLGWSNWTDERVNESLRISQSNSRLARPIFNSPYFSLFEMGKQSIHARGIQVTHEDMMNPNFQKGMLMNPYSPLGGFSILDKPNPSWENAKADAKKKYEAGDAYWKNVYHSIFTPENEERFHRAQGYTRWFNQTYKTNYTVDQVLNAYALAHVRTDFLTVGPITIEQVRRTIDSLPLSKKLTASDLNALYTVDRGGQQRMCSRVFTGR